eukprot:CAMPEP_0174363312 /NCGR_PEP_ID=MMETSP0811_2-20130205/68311_1 /TAXON_ID=73025 ORGANISM="Eutreptiella gymnastica-like, Strain CCMP1594" /NCGR_SAMPLE_ID=MMETSP0811_2 /ASSEMBLY_ACC=CAM_ASM_000667 /LENGTH=71 /DNA_ID=CAMNT_0015501899 /DNA_START=1015 /DNA_END=1230 /DNA_ORIENTATION=+
MGALAGPGHRHSAPSPLLLPHPHPLSRHSRQTSPTYYRHSPGSPRLGHVSADGCAALVPAPAHALRYHGLV